MVMLRNEDVLTKEVFDWTGVHLLHFAGSSCSQKTRIVLNLKGVDWNSREVNLVARENYSDWFMGINPRGLVPVLVHDGQVIIESNDIISHIEEQFPEPILVPPDKAAEMEELLRAEDELHLDLRAICFRYFFPGIKPRPQELQELYKKLGSGTVGGKPDPHKRREIAFHTEMTKHGGVSDAHIQSASARFADAFARLDARLALAPYLMGMELSLLDIAWYIYCYRLVNSGYPLGEKHPRLGGWFDGLDARPEFRREVAEPPPLVAMREAMHAEQKAQGATLAQVVGF